MSLVLPARRAPALLGFAVLLALAVPAAPAQSAPSQSAPQPGQFNLQMQAPLVIEDVVVLDGSNKPVHGLTAASFTVTDDGKPITPNFFEEHASSAPAPQPAVQQSALPALPTQGVTLFTNRNSALSGGPLNILLLDALNTPIKDQIQVRRQMLQVLTNLPPGVPIAIYGLSSHFYLIQGFTDDPAQLKAALTSKAAGSQASALLDNPVSGGPGATADAVDTFGLLAENNGNLAGALSDMQMFAQGDVAAYQVQQRTQRTLEAMAQLARYLSILPGRKNLIWFSAAFPLDIVPTGVQIAAANAAAGSTGSDAQLTTSMFTNSTETHFGGVVRVTDDLLRRSQVAIYPVDARGLLVDNSTDASSNIHPGTRLTQAEVMASAAGVKVATSGSASLTEPSDTVNNFAVQTAEEHQTMNQMAEETGGKAFYNNGDLKAAVQNAMALGSSYYTLSYTPPSGKWDGKVHKVEIKASQSGLHLTYRRRYYADGPGGEKSGQPAPQSSAMQTAMLHGAPDPGGLLFDVTASIAGNPTGQLAPGSRPDPKLMQPPYRTCTLTAHLDIHNLTMPTNADGAHQATIEFAMVVYDADGNLINQAARIGHLALPPDRYAQVLEHGLPIRQSIDVPATGVYFLRVGFHDPSSDKVGAVEIPVNVLKADSTVAQSTSQPPPAQP